MRFVLFPGLRCSIRVAAALLYWLSAAVPAFCGEIHEAARTGDLQQNNEPQQIPRGDATAASAGQAAERGRQATNENTAIAAAVGALKRGDFQTALNPLLPLAKQGSGNAQIELGNMYHLGQGVPRDDKEAVRLYRLAAEQGLVGAQHNLGKMYNLGQGVPQDYKEAVRLYRLAVEQGLGGAQADLGEMYHLGQGVPQDDKEAVRLYRLAAFQANHVGQYYLGVAYANGQGVPRDYVQAFVWFKAAVDSDTPAVSAAAIKGRDFAASKLPPETIAQITAMPVTPTDSRPSASAQAGAAVPQSPSAQSGADIHAAPQGLPATKLTSPDDLKQLASQIADLIAPFTLDDLRNGFKNEPSLSIYPPGVVVKKSSGVRETRTMTKARPAGGKVSVEVGLIDGNIEAVQFTLLPDRAGFQDVWNAKPVVVLSKHRASNASYDIGFETLEIRQGDKTTHYDLPKN